VVLHIKGFGSDDASVVCGSSVLDFNFRSPDSVIPVIIYRNNGKNLTKTGWRVADGDFRLTSKVDFSS
jgi:hypothetical protein